jgi:hypothetical protein
LYENKYFQFPLEIKLLDEKCLFYLFIGILCAKILCVNCALGGGGTFTRIFLLFETQILMINLRGR